MAAHLAIRDAYAALFTGLAGDRIYANREYLLAQEVVSQIHVSRVQSVPDRSLIGATAPIDWDTDIRTVILARKDGASGDSAELVADAIAVECFSRVMTDQTLGGVCDQIEPGPFTWEQDEADTLVVRITWDARVRHRTEHNAI